MIVPFLLIVIGMILSTGMGFMALTRPAFASCRLSRKVNFLKAINITPRNLFNRKQYPDYRTGLKLFSTKIKDEGVEPTVVPAKPSNFGEHVKELWNTYGYLAIGTYFSIYVTTLGTFFFCLDHDILNAGAFGLDPAHAVAKAS